MSKSFKTPIMSVIALLGLTSVTTTLAVAATGESYHRLFNRNNDNNWIIRKEDLEKEGDTFNKITNHNNIIEFKKTNNSVRNITPLTGLESVILTSTNSYLQILTGYNEDSFLYEKYLRNDGSNEFTVLLLGECYIQISSMNEHLNADDINISYTCSMNTEEKYDSNLEFNFDSISSSYSVKVSSSVTKSKVTTADIPMYFDDGVNGKHSVTSIEYQGFYNCTNLKWVSIPSTISSIGERTFYQCFNLNDLYIPDGPTTILPRTFYRCERLSNIRLPETLISLDDYSFYYAGGLTTLHLPNSIASISGSCFVQCPNLVEVNCPTSLSTIPGSFIYIAGSLRSFTIGTNITRVNDSAFKNLTDFTLFYEGTSADWELVNKSATGKYFNGCTNASVVILGDE